MLSVEENRKQLKALKRMSDTIIEELRTKDFEQKSSITLANTELASSNAKLKQISNILGDSHEQR